MPRAKLFIYSLLGDNKNLNLKEKISKTELIGLYRDMALIREFENETYRQYMQKQIKGFLHVYSGQEAIAVGVMSLLKEQDYVTTHYRDHGHALARGLDSKFVMAELFGKATGYSKGKGGSMHLFDSSRRFMGGYAIVAGQMPIATGLGLAAQHEKKNALVVCVFGDGAMQEGEFHESMNLAAIWKLPIVFICENNLYGMGAAVNSTYALHDELYKAGDAYKIPGYKIDGMDLFEVRNIMQEIDSHVRNGDGPVLIEAQTYRFRGHSISDPAAYRPKDEVEYWLGRDPIVLLRNYLIEQGEVTEEELQEADESVEKEVTEAVSFAQQSPFPGPEALYDDVYADEE